MTPALSIVMPAYNEAESVEMSVREWHGAVASKISGTEIIVVDDCSVDDTAVILSRLSSELPALRVVRSPVNEGHGPSVLKGLREAKGEYIFQTDSDNEFPVSEFWDLWKEREGNDFVLGVRRARADGPLREFISLSSRGLVFLLWGLWLRDPNCAFKLMKRSPLLKIFEEIKECSVIPMIQFSILARIRGCAIKEIEVTHLSRRGGSSSLTGTLKWASLTARCSREILALRVRR
jgi:glycosyltransferase involved in cell wall biosynthesis